MTLMQDTKRHHPQFQRFSRWITVTKYQSPQKSGVSDRYETCYDWAAMRSWRVLDSLTTKVW